MERDTDREDYTLRLLIEQLVREGRSEREINARVAEASSERAQARRPKPSRRPERVGVLGRRLRK